MNAPVIIEPATLAFDARGTPYSPAYGDIYHSADSGPGQAAHVFLGGNGLLNLVECLERGTPEIQVDEVTRTQAQHCITRMLDFTAARKSQAAGMTPGIGAA